MNPLSFKLYAGDGTQSLFSVTFPYISRSHVKVTVSGVDIAVPEWQDANTIRIVPAPAVGAVVEIKRQTSQDTLLVDFEDGSKINEAILNLSSRQLFYLAQEGLDRVTFDYQLASLETLKDAAEAAAAAGASAYSSFSEKYLGAKAADPATDNAGKPLTAGALYFKTGTLAGMRTWNGSAWETLTSLADSYVTAAKIANLAVTTAKLAEASVTASKLADASVLLSKLDTTGALGTVLTAQGPGLPPAWLPKFTPSAIVLTNSGSAIDITGIPAWATRISLFLDDVSTNGTAPLVIRGGSGSIDVANYTSTGSSIQGTGAGTNTNVTGFQLSNTDGGAGWYRQGLVVLTRLGPSNLWMIQSLLSVTGSPASRIDFGAGKKLFSGAIDRIRLTTGNGTDLFDAGSMTILWE